MGSLQLEPVEDVDALTEWVSVEAAAFDADHVGLPADSIESRLPTLDPSAPQGGERIFLHLARLDGVPVGTLEIRLPTYDNLTSASVDFRVHPSHRRQGVGRHLLDAGVTHVDEMGRSRVYFMAASPWPDGEGRADRMLERAGARPALQDIRRVLDLHASPLPAVPASPPGYSIIQWVDEAPDNLVEDLARLSGRMSTDPPQGELGYEPEAWTADRYREAEATARARCRTRYATAVIHLASGAAIGMTDIGVNLAQPTMAWQWATIVESEHRGHGLGLALKAANLELLVREMPAIRWVNTWNAAVNAHMIAVNDALGFRPVEIWTEWRLDL